MKNELALTTPSEREIRILRYFEAPRPRVFDCWTRPELLRRWMLGPPGWVFAVCEIDLRVGGAFRYVWRGPGGEELASGGVYREIVVPRRVVNTEKYDQDWTGGETLGTLELEEEGRRTKVTVTLLYSSKDARDGALRSGMAEGMGAGFDNLDEYLKTSA
jgi:uncharacterized protein YndB with AHSA1/START domain